MPCLLKVLVFSEVYNLIHLIVFWSPRQPIFQSHGLCNVYNLLSFIMQPNAEKELRLDDTSSAVPIMNCLAGRAHDYSKKVAVLRVTSSDWKVFLMQASNMLELQQWIIAINRASAMYSSPPLASAVGSGGKFIRPMYPMMPTSKSLVSQIYLTIMNHVITE